MKALPVMAPHTRGCLVGPALLAGPITLPILSPSLRAAGGHAGRPRALLPRGLPPAGEFRRSECCAVLVDGVDITRLRGAALEAVRRRYGVVFQGGALFDSMSVFDNVAFPLREKTKLRPAEIAQRVEQKLEQVGLQEMGSKNPAEIS